MVKYRFPGIGGSSLLFPGSSIGFHARLQLLTGPESHDSPGSYRNFLTRFRVSARPLILVAQIEVAEARKLYGLSRSQCCPQVFEEQIHKLARLALVQAELVEKRLGHIRFRECHAYRCQRFKF